MSFDLNRNFFDITEPPFQPIAGPLTPTPNKSMADTVKAITRCERQISGVQDHANCPNPASFKIVLSRVVSYWDVEEEVEYLCDTHTNVYLHDNDVTASELKNDGWMVAL